MKKKMLPLAVGAVAAVSMGASAEKMYIENSGLGEMLVLPFFSAENGNATNISVVNTTANGKAVKVRFLEGQNSQEVLDFNVYMSPYDHFTMAVSATADGGGQVVTNDNTCTVPQFEPGVPEPFRKSQYEGDKSGAAAAGTAAEYDNTSITRTAVGYVEIIEMGQLTKAEGSFENPSATVKANAMLAAITHDATGVPTDCTLPVKAWSTGAGQVPGQWKKEALVETAPGKTIGKGKSYFSKTWQGGGLYAYAGVVNAADATAFGEDGIAIAAAVDAQNGQGGWSLHYEPGDTNPDFQDPNLVNKALVDTGNALLEVNFPGSEIDAVSSLFQTDAVINDYVTDTSIAALTDWVLTFPTKTFYATQAKVADRAPFFAKWNGKNACEYANLKPWDREESNPAPAPGSAPDFSPSPDPEEEDVYDLPLCKEVTIVQFGDESAVKTDDLAVGVASQLPAADGWAKISLNPADLSDAGKALAHKTRLMTDLGGNNLRGLPVVGFAVQTYTNNNVNGSGNVANYAMSNEHKMVVSAS